MDNDGRHLEDSTGWSQKCICGKLFRQPNSYTNHIHSCTRYKLQLGNSLKGAQARWQASKGQKRRGQQTETGDDKAWLPDDADLDVDYPAPHIATSSSTPAHRPEQTGDLPVAQPADHDEGEGTGLGKRSMRPTKRYADFHATSAVPFNIPSMGLARSPSPMDHSISSLPSTSNNPQATVSQSGKQKALDQRLTIQDEESWKRTPKNALGLYKKYWTSEGKPHDPDFYLSEEDLYDLDEDTVPSPKRSSLSDMLHPFPNLSSFALGEWLWSEGDGKSRESFRQLIDIITDEEFSPTDVRLANWDHIYKTLGSSQYEDDGNDQWVDDGLSWQTGAISLQVPLNSNSTEPGPASYLAGTLRYRPLVPLIVKKLQDATHAEQFHIVPSELRWQAGEGKEDVRVYGEMYHSPAFLDAYREIQTSPVDGSEECQLPRYVVSLMFFSDETHLTSFGDNSVWPAYMCFGNDSKYQRAKPSLKLLEEIAYLQDLPDEFQDWFVLRAGKRIRNNDPLMKHLRREVFHEQWRLILDDDFVHAYKYGIVVDCFDKVQRRFFPRIMVYGADYPEKVRLVGVRNIGEYPCPRCLVPDTSISQLGTLADRAIRVGRVREDNASRKMKIQRSRKYIYQQNYSINSKVVENELKPTSLVPSQNAFSDRLSSLGLDVYSLPAVDPLHEVEIGAWKSLFMQLIRLLEAVEEGHGVNTLNLRFRQVPTFGQDTIRRFCANVSEMRQFAAREFEDALQCCIAVFDGLFPEEHDGVVLNLLFTFAHWHSLVKMRLHTDQTLAILDRLTTTLGEDSREFMLTTCGAFETRELQKEYEARIRRQAREAARQANSMGSKGPGRVGSARGGKGRSKAIVTEPPLAESSSSLGASVHEGSSLHLPSSQENARTQSTAALGTTVSSSDIDANSLTVRGKQPRKLRTWSLNTPKFHALGDAVAYIRRYGTTDSYSTQLSERSHRFSKARYNRTNKKDVERQLSLIQTRSARLKRLRKQLLSPSEEDGEKSTRQANLEKNYIVARSQNQPISLFDFLRLNVGDMALKGFLPKLKHHLFPRTIAALLEQARVLSEEHASSISILQKLAIGHTEKDLSNLHIHADRLYRHSTLQVNYTTYDGHRARDILNPSTSRRDIMCLLGSSGDTLCEAERYLFGRIIGIFHVNVIYSGPGMLDYGKLRLDFVWVRWFKNVAPSSGWSSKRLDRLAFESLADESAFAFLDPADIVRAAHIIPRFALGTVADQWENREASKAGKSKSVPKKIYSKLAKDHKDWVEYYLNRFVDRDMTMRFHWGLAVGHRYGHTDAPEASGLSQGTPMDVDIPAPILQPPQVADGEDTDPEDLSYDAGSPEQDDYRTLEVEGDHFEASNTSIEFGDLLEDIQEPESSDEEGDSAFRAEHHSS